MSKPSINKALFSALCEEDGLPVPETEFRFHPVRKWRFDFAWPDLRIALEVEGGVWVSGRHNRASGFMKDMEKYNAAGTLGWIVLRCVPKALMTDDTVGMIRSLIEWREQCDPCLSSIPTTSFTERGTPR